MAEFDRFGGSYKEVLDREISISGESSEHFARQKAELVRRHISDAFRGRILDYGCGIGLVACSLRDIFPEANVKITGYDVSKEVIAQASALHKGIVFTDDIGAVNGSKFDVIILANVLHHIGEDDRRSLVGKLYDLLNAGGEIFVFEHNPYNPATQYIVRSSEIDKDASLLGIGHSCKLLKDAGFYVRRRMFITFFPHILKALRGLEPMIGWLPLGAQYVCIGKKR